MGCCNQRPATNSEARPKPEVKKENKKSLNALKTPKKEQRHKKKISKGSQDHLSTQGSIIVSTKGKPLENYKIMGTLKTTHGKSIYLTKEKNSQTYKIVKEYNKSSLDDANKIYEQLKVLKDLDHPNIVKIFGLVDAEGAFFIIQEYCTGGELFDKIIKQNAIGENLAARYMRDILSAINYCHSQGIAHRNLNPESLVLDNPDDNAILKISDFESFEKIVRTTRYQKRSIGNTYYMAPELFKGEYGKEIDIWSAGVILCTLISGNPPFHGKTRDEIFNSIQKGLDLSSSDYVLASDEAKDLISKMLEKDPKMRITAEEALNHPWIENRANNKVPDNVIVSGTLDRLAKFTVKSKVEQSILNFISYQITSVKEEHELSELFRSIDENGDGRISKAELMKAYKKKKLGSKDEINSIMENCDKNNSGFIEYQEFVTGVSQWNKKIQARQLREVFGLCDGNGDGLLSLEELKGCIPGIEGSEWDKFFVEVDSNQDHLISVDELKTYFETKFQLKE
ncbi:CDPK1_35 [Blepharisma stoltei]|uniref:Calcium-dependent protein kinase n=1 Tax=Blepharisma stoltei TaxID=1481888 RepID=A0AAU9J4M8_9CILI|nr:unnamed protein product [Blepharisma stoltei]